MKNKAWVYFVIIALFVMLSSFALSCNKSTPTPTTVNTSEPAPSVTVVPTLFSPTPPTSTPTYPKPVLVSPATGSVVAGEQLTEFSWLWDGVLQEGELFCLRIWRPEMPCQDIATPRKSPHQLSGPPDGFGQYLWQIAVVRIDEKANLSTLVESQVWPFIWSDALPTATPVVPEVPILHLTKASHPNPVDAGKKLTYTLVVASDASANGSASGLIVTDILPTNTTFLTATQQGFSGPSGRVITWTLADELEPGSSITVTFTVAVSSSLADGTILTNTAWVTSTQGLGKTATETTTVHSVPITPCLPDASFVEDVTVPDGEEFKPGQQFTKTWRMLSCGCAPWPEGTTWAFVSGEQLGAPSSVPVKSTPLSSTVDISVSMVAPDTPGTHKGFWQMRDPSGTNFGERVYVLITVPGDSTPTATPTSTLLPAPTLSNPPNNAQYCSGTDFWLEWQWSARPFEANEFYGVKVWKVELESEEWDRHWEEGYENRRFKVRLVSDERPDVPRKKKYYQGLGEYHWNVVVLHDTGEDYPDGSNIGEYISEESVTGSFLVCKCHHGVVVRCSDE